jgi:hypothetical protein
VCINVALSMDPHGACAGESGCGGACDGNGQCRFELSGILCDLCKACDGAGHCDQLPVVEDDQRCGTISCAGLSTECVSFHDLTARRCIALGLCASPNDPSTCMLSHAFVDGTACSTGICRNGQCIALAVDAGAGDAGVAARGGGCSYSGRQRPCSLWLIVVAILLAFRRHGATRRLRCE